MNMNERIEKLEFQLSEYLGKIKKLDDVMNNVDSKLREKYQEDVANLHTKSDKARARLHLFKLKQAQSWEEETIGTAILGIFDELGESLDHLFSKIDKQQKLH